MYANNTLGKMQPVEGKRAIRTSVMLGARSKDSVTSSQGNRTPLKFKDNIPCSKMKSKKMC